METKIKTAEEYLEHFKNLGEQLKDGQRYESYLRQNYKSTDEFKSSDEVTMLTSSEFVDRDICKEALKILIDVNYYILDLYDANPLSAEDISDLKYTDTYNTLSKKIDGIKAEKIYIQNEGKFIMTNPHQVACYFVILNRINDLMDVFNDGLHRVKESYRLLNEVNQLIATGNTGSDEHKEKQERLSDLLAKMKND